MAETTTADLETTTAVAAATPSTLYPKISGDIRDILHHLDKHHSRNGSAPAESLSLTGTVKLHGTHADIRVHPDGRIIAQSRNNAALSAERDNFDFAKFCHQRHPAILRLASHIRARWTELHPSAPSPAATATLILAGEWIGHKIQARLRLRAWRAVSAGLSRAGTI
ncbi:hypothetical protein GTA08_BOTSDO08052 [Neofusicoccum parvum]|uniref:Uncharacterized protein n=1 Tax=Neofusicoccum parvum TaxID=310453 RepID=A0ACB5SJD9_9PEZI|nr:hypothetical protein GTA08_BOTSDO08052 [Neofusicoccum parvum]